MLTSKGWEPQEPVIMPCLKCDEVGMKDKQVLEAEEKAWKEFWCSCGKSEEAGVTYYRDGEHPGCSKHHYRCNNCDKVTQTG